MNWAWTAPERWRLRASALGLIKMEEELSGSLFMRWFIAAYDAIEFFDNFLPRQISRPSVLS
jgi:hypothetical protein